MSPEAGWYHAQGDPPGTVRRWNGSSWIGFPIEPPAAEGRTSTANRGVGVEAFRPVAGQAPLKVIAVLTQVGLLLSCIAALATAVAAFALSSSAAETVDRIEEPAGGTALLLGVSMVGAIVLSVITAVLFVIWFYLAYRNISLWHRTRRSMMWTVLAWIVPFISLVRPMTLMLELVERSPRKERQGDLSPVPVVAWWILLLVSQSGMFFFGVVAADDADELARNVFIGIGLLAVFRAMAAGFAIYIVQAVTDAQETRRRPSAAQQAQLQRHAEVAAFNQSQSGGHAFE